MVVTTVLKDTPTGELLGIYTGEVLAIASVKLSYHKLGNVQFHTEGIARIKCICPNGDILWITANKVYDGIAHSLRERVNNMTAKSCQECKWSKERPNAVNRFPEYLSCLVPYVALEGGKSPIKTDGELYVLPTFYCAVWEKRESTTATPTSPSGTLLVNPELDRTKSNFILDLHNTVQAGLCKLCNLPFRDCVCYNPTDGTT